MCDCRTGNSLGSGLPAGAIGILDAAVLDIDLAGELIWPVAEELRRRGVPLIFVSAYQELPDAPPLFEAAPHLEKPLEEKRLVHELGAIWGA
jgi:DNA-binding response OmpR family regulator